MKTAITAIAGLAIAGTASAQSLTFDLSGLSIDSLANGSVSVTLTGVGAGPVAGIEYNINYGPAAGSLSWTEELAMELAAPGAALSGLGPGAGNGAADGTIHFGSTVVSAFNVARDINADVLLGG
ncbi:MAG: hypothetical protein CMJ31_10785, partial [Phycisphaerae bacterium]|nr:hypothetical protein [Phycisphaerae bacterium]